MRRFLLAFLVAALLPELALADCVLRGRVVGVSDGDTITLLDAGNHQHKVRLAGIDAPEKKQAFGNRSKENLSRLVFDRFVEAHCHKRDRYGRELCKVMRGSSDVNLEQIMAGFAWWYRQYADEQTLADRISYGQAEDEARAARRGLWKDTSPTPPWQWRKAH